MQICYLTFNFLYLTNFLCSNILLNSARLSTNFIYIAHLDILLQLLTENKAHYLEIKGESLNKNLDNFYATLSTPCPIWKFQISEADDRRATHQCFHFKKLEFSFCVLILDEISFTYFQIPLKLPKNPRLKNKTLFGSYFLYRNLFKD